MIAEEPKINIDKQGRICDPQGRPLRDKAHRTYVGAFMGRPAGSPHPRSKRLEQRIKDFEVWEKRTTFTAGRRKPGSVKG